VGWYFKESFETLFVAAGGLTTLTTGRWGIDKEELGGGHWQGRECTLMTQKEAGTVVCALAHLQVQRCNKTTQT
jgi:hypothetical protein